MTSVLVMGGGMGGLSVALALKNHACEVTIVERDSAPPELASEDAFEKWKRPGSPQIHHSHIFLARLHSILRNQHPELLAELYEAGLRAAELKEMLPPTHVDSYEESPGDRDLKHLWGRRATFEYVLRRHVGRLPRVRFIHDARVIGLLTQEVGGRLRVAGVEMKAGDRVWAEHADVVVDASGKRSQSHEWLGARGVEVKFEEHESRYAYVCRHYRLKEGAQEPSRRGTGANLDYLWFGLFYAEHGHFSIAMACPTAESALVAQLQRVEGFERVCQCIPVLRSWVERAQPVSKVMGARKLANRWLSYGERGKEALGFFPVGDSHLYTNPMYGRGCSSAFVQSHVLAEVLASTDDPRQQVASYYARCREALRSHFESATAADRLFLNRASLQRGVSLPLPDRLLNYLYDAAWTPALLASPLVAREMIKAMQMRELSDKATRLRVVAHVVLAFLRRLLRGSGPELPALGPGRDELLSGLRYQEEEAVEWVPEPRP